MDSSPPLALRPALQVAGIGRRIAAWTVAWPVASQQGSRRNAMLAATEIRRRRREQLEVEEFLAAVPPRRTAALG